MANPKTIGPFKLGPLFGNFLDAVKEDDLGTRESPVRKRYWLFAGHSHFTKGGMGDFKGQGDDLDALHKQAEDLMSQWKGCNPWAHILDSWTGEVAQVQEKAIPTKGKAK